MCEVDFDNGDCASVWSQRPRVARIPHECDCCRGAIVPGAHYLSHFSVYDGNASIEKACFACWVAMEEFRNAHGSGYMPSDTMRTLEECYREDDDAKGSRWRNHLSGMWRRWRTSRGGRAQLAKEIAQREARRALAAEALRRWPGATRVRANRELVTWIGFPGSVCGAEWYGGDDVRVYPVDLAAWFEFDKGGRKCGLGFAS